MQETENSYIERRKEICNTCEHKNHILNLCKYCNCFIPIKVMIKGADCPIQKWKGE
jgi:hypothetical protein